MMAVMDEYGVTVGVITMEDLLEEIVGEIRDEYDTEKDDGFVQVAEHIFEVPGSMNLNDLNDRLHTELSSDDYDSVGGLLMEKLDRLPEEGDTVLIGDVTLKAIKVDGTKIETVRVEFQ